MLPQPANTAVGLGRPARLSAIEVVDAGTRVAVDIAQRLVLFLQGLEQYPQAQVFVDVGEITRVVLVLVGDKAKTGLGYVPVIGVAEGMQALISC